MYKKIN